MWKVVKDYPNYRVNDNGLIYSINRNKFIKPRISNCNYLRVVLYNNEGHKELSIHRLVAQAFIPQMDGKNDVNHKNGNKQDNRVENLEWCTKSENIRHAQDIGLKTYETISRKVQAKKEKEIKQFNSVTEAGKYLGVGHSAICLSIKRGRPCKGYVFNYC